MNEGFREQCSLPYIIGHRGCSPLRRTVGRLLGLRRATTCRLPIHLPVRWVRLMVPFKHVSTLFSLSPALSRLLRAAYYIARRLVRAYYPFFFTSKFSGFANNSQNPSIDHPNVGGDSQLPILPRVKHCFIRFPRHSRYDGQEQHGAFPNSLEIISSFLRFWRADPLLARCKRRHYSILV
jgi:hypothetical protein